MAYTGLSDDSDTLITTPSVSFDPGLSLDDEIKSASESSVRGTTILSSAPSSPSRSFPNDRSNGGTINAPSESSLSLNPSMVDSSVLVPSESNSNAYWIGLHRADPSQSSSISSSDISSCAPSAPDLFGNIGRSLVLASVSSDSDDIANESDCDDTLPTSKLTEATSPKRVVKWWDQLQTDEDWDVFRAKANAHLNSLVKEEMARVDHGENSNGTEYSADKKSVINGSVQQNNEGMSKVRQWLQGLYDALTATTVGADPRSESASYVSALIKEAAEIQRQLDRLPPVPPTLPDLPLDELLSESRELLVQYHVSLGAWKGETMPQREELTARYVQCQEKLLAEIIDAEEEFFYKEKDNMQDEKTLGDDRNKDEFGATNGEGYIEVVPKESPQWDDVNEAVIVSQSKCQLTFSAVIVAALTGGLTFFLAMQPKRR